jgi:glyoxylase-like metal-dependent hydrolase (beta-lactamase superfamily II)
VLGVLIGIGVLSLAVAAQQPAGGAGGGRGAAANPNAPKVVEVDKIKDNLYVLRGGGGNTAAFIGTNGIVVVDTKNIGWGQPLLDKIKSLSDKPITTIINTHSHGDHTSGNVEFPTTVDVITSEGTKAEIEAWRPVTGIANPFPNVFKDNANRNAPKRTYKETMSIGAGNDKIDLHFFGPGHTGGDTWVVFSALRTVHAGDIFANKNLPLIDANNGGKGVPYAQTLAKAVAGLPNIDTVITGHAPTVMTMADLREFAEFNKEFATWVEGQMKAGKTVDQAAAEYTKHPDKYKGYGNVNANRVKANIQIYYDKLKTMGGRPTR